MAYFYFLGRHFFDSINGPSDQTLLQQNLIRRSQLTVKALSEQLRALVSINSCDLFVHQLGEGLLVVLMRAQFNINQHVALHQQAICEIELKRIVTLVQNQSPAVQMLFPLALLRYNETIAAKMDALTLQEKDGARRNSVSFALLIVCILMHKYMYSNNLGRIKLIY